MYYCCLWKNCFSSPLRFFEVFLGERSRCCRVWGKDDLLALPQLCGTHIRPKLPLLSRNKAVRQLPVKYFTIANCYHDYSAEYNAYLLCVYAALGYVATQAVKVSIGLSVVQMLSIIPAATACYFPATAG